MLSRSILRSALDVRWTPSSQLSPTFLLPCRAYLHQATTSTQFQATPPEIPPQSTNAQSTPSPAQQQQPPTSTIVPTAAPPNPSSSTYKASPPHTKRTKPLILSESLLTLLPHLHAQPPHYITAHIHARPYLLTTGDTLRLPFHMPHVQPGDILRLNRASSIGSRDYTLKAPAAPKVSMRSIDLEDLAELKSASYLDERLFVCRVRVVGTESEPMRIKEKTKRRQRRVKTVRSKHKYTVCRVVEVRVTGLEELRAMEGGEA